LDFCYLRQDDWDNVVTAHNDSTVHLWNVKNHGINEKLKIYSKGNVKNVCLSKCGNFVVIGKSNGKLEKWNVQSGLLKGIFDDSNFGGSISGIAIDSLNSVVVSSDWDGCLKFWDFKTLKLISSQKSDSPITKLIKSNCSNLIAIVTDDFDIKIYDIRTSKMIRNFTQKNKINDLVNEKKFKIRYFQMMQNSLLLLVWTEV
jgi:U3 small nucleolar RNA-associated protein 21